MPKLKTFDFDFKFIVIMFKYQCNETRIGNSFADRLHIFDEIAIGNQPAKEYHYALDSIRNFYDLFM